MLCNHRCLLILWLIVLQSERQAIVERLNTLRQLQLPAVDAACSRLESVLQADPYLQQRLVSVTVEAHNKALYSLHKCVFLTLWCCHHVYSASGNAGLQHTRMNVQHSTITYTTVVASSPASIDFHAGG